MFLGLLSLATAPAHAQAWWDPSYTQRARLTFTNPENENLDQFTVLAVLDETTNFRHSAALPTGNDLAFIDADGSTVLNYEIERWNDAGKSYIWVLVPRIDANSTTDHVWMYFNNPAVVGPGENPTAVWPNTAYDGVYHFDGDLLDSSTPARNGTNVGTTDTAGPIGRARDIGAGSNRIALPNESTFDYTNAYTISFWTHVDRWDSPDWDAWVTKGDNAWRITRWGNSDGATFIADNAGGDLISNGSMLGGAGFWVTAVQNNGGNYRGIWINGVEIAQEDPNGNTRTNNEPVWIGNNSDHTGRALDGQMDEVRLQKVSRTPSWIKVDYLSVTDSLVTWCSPWLGDDDMDGSCNADDCEDDEPDNWPGNTEICDGIDNDCDTVVDEDCTYVDSDGDGFGDPLNPGPGVDDNTDCDDADDTIHPGHPVVVNDGKDNDCSLNNNGVGDECYEDLDDDGVSNNTVIDSADGDCTDPREEPTDDPIADCDDANPTVFPGQSIVVDNGQDDDCSLANGGVGDECYTNADGDHEATSAIVDSADGDCLDGAEWPLIGNDCDDNDPNNFHGNAEVCDGNDNDCDTLPDNGLPFDDYWLDDDGDQFGVGAATNACQNPGLWATVDGDCNDGDPAINPMAMELTCNSIDENCNGPDDDNPDADQDGSGVCQDCNDTDPTRYPGALEVCNDIDDNCNTDVDEGLPTNTYYVDDDNDGFGDAEVQYCGAQPPVGAVVDPGDCDDDNPVINPDATEICNGIDDDCDGTPDDNLLDVTYYFDSDNDGFGGINDLTTCMAPPTGYVLVDGDCDDTNVAINPLAAELCDPIDRNCDGSATLGATDALPFYLDDDDDGYGTPDVEVFACVAPPRYVDDDSDCNDALSEVNPGVAELCGTVFDDDCDGQINEGDAFDALTFYADADGDGSGTAVTTTACSRPVGFAATLGPDCDDADPNNFPGGIEQCDGADNNCNTTIDEDVIDQTFYADNDGDGFGDPATSNVQCAPDVHFPLLNSDDCNDQLGLVNPDAEEVCDGIDNNCFGGESDASDARVFYTDADDDGYGDGASPIIACTAGLLEADVPGDCDDADGDINPAAAEVCDQVDNDCNGIIDVDSAQVLVWYFDGDLDGFGAGPGLFACSTPGPDYSRVTNDCDDSDGTVYPGALEVCDQVDNDCDLAVDIDDPDYTGPRVTYYADADADTHGDADAPLESCESSPPDGYAATQDDCLDTDATVSPSATEIFCDGIDQDCSGDLESTNQGFVDGDGDGYGDGNELCDDNADLVANGGDCDDTDVNVNPGAEEICDNLIDDDCQAGDEVCAVEPSAYIDTGCRCDTANGPSWVGLGMLLLLASSVRRKRTA